MGQSITTQRCPQGDVRVGPYSYTNQMASVCRQWKSDQNSDPVEYLTADEAKAACESDQECTAYMLASAGHPYRLCVYPIAGGGDIQWSPSSSQTWQIQFTCQAATPCTNADCLNLGTLNAADPGNREWGCKCDCVNDWTGDVCDVARPCADYDCQNGGTLNNAAPGDKVQGCKCDCQSGWTGDLCDVQVTQPPVPVTQPPVPATQPPVPVTQPPVPPLPPTPSSGSSLSSSSGMPHSFDQSQSSSTVQKSSSSSSSSPGAPILIPSASSIVPIPSPTATSSAISSNSSSGSAEDLGLYMPSASGPLPDTGSVLLAVLLSSFCVMQRPRKD